MLSRSKTIQFQIAQLVFCCLSATAFGGGVPTWRTGDGNWEDAAKWGGTLPAALAQDDITGKSKVTIDHGEVTASRLDIGESAGADAAVIMNGGSVTATEFVRLGEYPGSHGRFILNGGRLCTNEIGLGGMNEGEISNPPCRAEMEIRGGILLTRYLMLGWRVGSVARLHVVGSKAASIVSLNTFDCAIPASQAGSRVELDFDLDAGGVTPIILWNKRESIRLARKDRPGKCLLHVGLLDVPPGGDITLMRSLKPCVGTFTDVPEGSLIRVPFAGKKYEWRLTYHGGAGKADIVLCDPQLIGAAGDKTPYQSGKVARTVNITSAAIKTSWEAMYKVADQGLPAVGTGTLAFPGAEGFGAHAQGGRGGKVLFVANLNDSGHGSLREAIEAKGPRTVIFKVGGIIEVKKPLQIREPFITIAGQTAPGGGICLKGSEDTLTLINTHDVIVRYLRVRTGHTGDKDANEGDCISCYSADNFIIDHCSTSWGTDETLSCTQACDRYTVQWSVIAEGLDYYGHSMGSILGGDRSTWHHNLYAHCRTRNPRFAGLCRCDFRNNVIFDWGDTCGYGDFRWLNYVNNYVKPGPSTTQNPVLFLKGESVLMPGSLFMQGNVMDGAPEFSGDNRKGTGCDDEAFAEAPRQAAEVNTQTAALAFDAVLNKAGATLPKRDAVDRRLAEEVRNGTGKIVRYESDLATSWPAYAAGQAPVDSMEDGIPDEWKHAHGLPLNDPGVASLVNQAGYTNLELYLNSLMAPHAPVKVAGGLPEIDKKPLIRVVLVGDSTVTDTTGWGRGFKQHLAPNVVCANRAAGGRSSKSFRDEGRWEPALALKPGYVFIQFGHNDEPGKGPERETDPNTTFTENMGRYVDEARRAGAKPVLVTSIARRRFDKDGKVLADPGLMAYVDAVRRLAEAKKVPLLDLQTRTLELYAQLGKEGCEKQISPITPEGTVDSTHLNAAGSVMVGGLVAEELRRAVPELAGMVLK